MLCLTCQETLTQTTRYHVPEDSNLRDYISFPHFYSTGNEDQFHPECTKEEHYMGNQTTRQLAYIWVQLKLWRKLKSIITKWKKCCQGTHNQLTLYLNVFPHVADHHSHFPRDTIGFECCYHALRCLVQVLITKFMLYSLYVTFPFFILLYTGCFTTLGHNCRRWFPRSLWWKKFI